MMNEMAGSEAVWSGCSIARYRAMIVLTRVLFHEAARADRIWRGRAMQSLRMAALLRFNGRLTNDGCSKSQI